MADQPRLTRQWEVFVVHHSHTDIGYTEPQPIIIRKQTDYLVNVLDLCAATDGLPPGERFAWTCEASWVVKAFLRKHPQRAEEFFRRVREGRIELTGLALQLTDLFGEELLRYSLAFAAELAREHDLGLVTAMNNDVNGWTWGLPRLLAEHGIRYLDTAINNVRALNVTPRPRPFHWASPDGSRVLMWHGTSYLHGNALGFGMPGADDRLLSYLAELEAESYPHNAVCVKVQGQVCDNSPPAPWLPGFIRSWNERHSSPRLRLVTSREWFEHIEADWPEPIHEWRAAWPDWWADGLGSYPYESAIARAAQADLASAQAIGASGAAPPDPERVEAVSEAAMFFCEHTGGAWCSTDLPDALDTKAQQAINSAFAYTAAVEGEALLRDTAAAAAPHGIEGPAVVVFNPLPFPRTDLVEVVIRDDAFLPGKEEAYVTTRVRQEALPELHLVDLETGRAVPAAGRPHVYSATRYPAQRVSFIAHDVPARGRRAYRIVAGPLGTVAQCRAEDRSLAGPHFQLEFDPQTGGANSAVAAAPKRQLVGPHGYTLNQFVHEVIDSPRGREDLCYWGERHDDTPFARTTPPARLRPGAPSPLGASLIAESGGGDVPSMRSEIALYDDLPRIDIANTIAKLPSSRAEAVYHAFPFAAASPTVYLDLPGALMRPGLDQVPGTATDWYAVQRFFAVADPQATVVVATPDVPLVQINAINTGRWQAELPAHTGLAFSWVMNNYWFTNWPQHQWGVMTYRYSIACLPGPFDAEAAARFGAALRQPLVAHVIPGAAR